MSKYTEQIIKYLDDELNSIEKMEFEDQIRKQSEIREEVDLQKDMRNFLEKEAFIQEMNNAVTENGIDEIVEEAIEEYKKSDQSEINEFRKKSNDSYNRYKEKNARLKKYVKVYSYAASFLILVATVWYLYIANNKVSNTELYAMYYKPYESMHNSRSSQNERKKYDEAYDYYETKDFTKAYSLLKPLVVNGAISEQFYLGIVCMELENYDEAEEYLKIVISKNGKLFTSHAEWYLMLCYLNTSQIEKAKIVLKQIISHEGQYKKNAEEILQTQL